MNSEGIAGPIEVGRRPKVSWTKGSFFEDLVPRPTIEEFKVDMKLSDMLGNVLGTAARNSVALLLSPVAALPHPLFVVLAERDRRQRN